MDQRIYKVVSRQLWAEAELAGVYRGAPIDLQDGFIHFSAASQVVETVARHFVGQDDLLLVEVETAKLGDALKWERARGGELFPHLYGDLPLGVVRLVVDLPLGSAGTHEFPANFANRVDGDCG